MLLYSSSLNSTSLSERGVTANIPVLGTGDSGFESRRSDHFILSFFVGGNWHLFLVHFYVL